MKKRIITVLLTLILVSVWLPVLADTLTYSIFDVEIPFKSIVDCQRTLKYAEGEMQYVWMFKYPYVTADSSVATIETKVSDVIDNPQNYYYKFIKNNNQIGLALYHTNDPDKPSCTVSTVGYIQSHGNGCFIYVSNGYGYFVSFRAENSSNQKYHMCSEMVSGQTGCTESHDQHYVDKFTCISCGCGDSFMIVAYKGTIEELEELPMQEGLVEIEHQHQYTDGQCPCGAQPISFGSNGGSGEMTQEPVKAGDVLVLPECEFTPPKGQTFVCWLVKGEFEIVGKDKRAFSWIAHAKADVKEQLLYPGETIKVLGPIEIEAQWQKTQEMPHTGDDSRAALWLCLLGMAGAGMYLLRKRAYN